MIDHERQTRFAEAVSVLFSGTLPGRQTLTPTTSLGSGTLKGQTTFRAELLHVLFSLREIFFYIFRCLIVNHHRVDAIFLAPRPSHDPSGHEDRLIDRQVHRQRTPFANSQRQIAREPSTSEREIPQRAVTLKQTCLVNHGTADGNATAGTNRKRHGSVTSAR